MYVKWLLTQYQQGHETCDHSTNNTYHVPPTVPGTSERGQTLVLCPCPSAIASCHILPLWAFKGWKPAARMVRMAGQKRRGAWGSGTATSYSASLGNSPPRLLYKRKGKWPDFLVLPPYIMLSVLIILKYIVCVIFFATVVLVCFYIPPDSFEGFIFLLQLVVFITMTLHYMP